MTSTAAPVVAVNQLRKQYGENVVLSGVDLSVAEGEVAAIIGPSGAGKSTLLRCINLLEVPDAGSVTVAGKSIAIPQTKNGRAGEIKASELAQLRRKVGMVFQSFNLFPHMTVLRNITLPQERVLGRGREEAEARAMELLSRVGLAAKAKQYPARCSGGQQQRVAIARALALDPEVMLFDEPTSALDPELGVEVLAVMRELADSGMTMIVVTHEMSFARNVSDHLVVMADGGIIEQGEPAQIFTEPTHDRTRQFLRTVLDR